MSEKWLFCAYREVQCQLCTLIYPLLSPRAHVHCGTPPTVTPSSLIWHGVFCGLDKAAMTVDDTVHSGLAALKPCAGLKNHISALGTLWLMHDACLPLRTIPTSSPHAQSEPGKEPGGHRREGHVVKATYGSYQPSETSPAGFPSITARSRGLAGMG